MAGSEVDFRNEIDALRGAEQKFRTVLDSVGVVVWQADPVTFALIYVSKTIESLGYTVEEAMRPGFWVSMLVPEDRQWAVPLCKGQVEQRKNHTIEYRAFAGDGSIRWIRDVITVRDHEGVVELYGVFIDITDTKDEEERRRYAHSLLQATIEASPTGVAIIGGDGRVVLENTSLRGMLGDDTLDNWISDTEFTHDAPAECCAQGPAGGAVTRDLKISDGRVIERRAVPICGEANEYFGHLLLLRDVTSDRTREDELREREEHYRSLIEHSSDIISVTDVDGTVRYKSASVERVLGYTAEELIGHNDFQYILDEDHPVATGAVDSLMSTRQPQQVEFRVRHKNGSTRWLSVVCSLLTTREGPRIIFNSRDITERKALEASLAQAHRMTSMGHLAATIAHEMNNVLMAIQSNSEVLRRLVPEDARLQRLVKHVDDSVRRGRRTTEEILRFTKPAEPQLRPLDVARWLRDLVAETESMIGSGVRISLRFPEEPVHIMGDAAALNQALTNILGNARDAMRGRGQIVISVERDASIWTSFGGLFDHFAHISIRDDGPGMPRHVAECIFEPLFTTKERGTGLGLAVTHQVIAAHGGMINVESVEGEGTTFHLFLPRTAETEVVLPPSLTSIPQGLRVLMIEDEPLVSEGLSYALSLEGAHVRVVERGSEAVTAAEEFQPAVVLLDVGLPDMAGTDVFAQLHERWPSLPVIFSTGHADAGRLQELLSPPVVNVALKPYDMSEILIKIHDAIGLQVKAVGAD